MLKFFFELKLFLIKYLLDEYLSSKYKELFTNVFPSLLKIAVIKVFFVDTLISLFTTICLLLNISGGIFLEISSTRK